MASERRRPGLTLDDLAHAAELRALGVPWEAIAEVLRIDVRALRRTLARRVPCPVCGATYHYTAHLWAHLIAEHPDS